MANRHLSRSIVLQTLFEWDFNGMVGDGQELLVRNIAEFGPGLDDDVFMNALLSIVLKKRVILDEIITKAAPDWPIDKISAVDRNVLRIGLVELLFGDRTQVPPKVAINEAIELAKSFGGENSGKFVNGVLGAVYKEIGEPGKDDVKKQKTVKTPVDPSTFPIEKKVGAVIYHRGATGVELCFVHDVFGYWTLSKGGIEADEDERTGLARKILEETGLDIAVEDVLGDNEYIASHPEKGKIRKHVYYFLAQAKNTELHLKESGGLDGLQWFPLAEVANLTMYDDILPMITKAVEIISK